jgi:predicted translin family RNA/ssDNA-binding protein
MAGKLRIQSKELAHEAELVNEKIEEQGHVFDLVRKSMADVTKIDIRDFFTKSTEAAEDALKKLQERTQGFADSMKSSFEAGFMSMVDGTKSVKDAFKQMAIDIIAQLYRVLVVQRIVGAFDASAGTGTGIVGGIMKLAGGMFRANGGPVSGNKPYIVGERGPEMFIPNRSGTVIPNKNMGGGGVVVQQTINVTTGVQQTVRNEIQTLLPQIAEASKAAVLDARRRGGSFANAF